MWISLNLELSWTATFLYQKWAGVEKVFEMESEGWIRGQRSERAFVDFVVVVSPSSGRGAKKKKKRIFL